jgi:hypothetical protein
MAGSDSGEEREDRSAFRRAGFVAAGGGSSPGGQAASPSASATSAAPIASGCHPSDKSQQIPQDAPTATWTVYKSIAVPSSPTAGPLVLDGEMARCYARTPTGALIAAWQLYVRHIFSDDWRRITDEQVMPGPGRDAFTRKRATVTGDTSDPGTYGQVAGFKFVTYTKDTAVIQIVTRFTDGTMQVGTETVIWSAGDWRLQLQPDGQDSPNFQQVQSLDGFVPWGGV